MATTNAAAAAAADTIAGKRILGFTPAAGSTERTKLLRLRVIGGHNLAKKDIFGASDPYTRIDLVTQVRPFVGEGIEPLNCATFLV